MKFLFVVVVLVAAANAGYIAPSLEYGVPALAVPEFAPSIVETRFDAPFIPNLEYVAPVARALEFETVLDAPFAHEADTIIAGPSGTIATSRLGGLPLGHLETGYLGRHSFGFYP